MSGLSKAIKITGLVLVLAVAGVLVGWFVSGRISASRMAPALMPALAIETASSRKPAESTPFPAISSTGVTPGNLLTNWEERVEEILGSSGGQANKGRLLLEVLPRCQAEGQVEVVQHLSNLLPDPDFHGLGSYLTNSALSEPARDALIVGLLKRPNSVRLPWLLVVARQGRDPQSAKARDWLQALLDADHHQDWAAWETNVVQYLQRNPD